jgi:branched-chain amino acid aminotransferase
MNLMWFDGAIQHSDAIGIHPFTHALHYGSGVFEGIRAYETPRGTALFRLEDHLRRFFQSARAYGLEISYDEATLQEAIWETVEANTITLGYIRPLAFFGEGGIALTPRFRCRTHVLIAVQPLTGSLIGTDAGARVCISPWQKTSSRALPAAVKACGHYMNSILALQDAVARGFDEAILLNDRGEVAEGSGENIFVVRNGRLHTNDASADILEGITRATVLELARDLSIPIEIGRIEVRELFEADELFFTGTAAEVMPITQVDEHHLRSANPVTDELRRVYGAAVRCGNPLHFDWLAFNTSISSRRGVFSLHTIGEAV